MINDIFAPALEKRSWEVVAKCESINEELFSNFNTALKNLKKHVQLELINDLNIIEDLFVQKTTEAVIQAHRMGFEDYRQICNEIKVIS